MYLIGDREKQQQQQPESKIGNSFRKEIFSQKISTDLKKNVFLFFGIVLIILVILLVIRSLSQEFQSNLINRIVEKSEPNGKNELWLTREMSKEIIATDPTTSTTTSTTTTTPTTTTITTVKTISHLLATIVINRARVPNKDRTIFSAQSDTYVKVFVDNEFIGKTQIQKNTLSPQWNYQVTHLKTLRLDQVIQFELFDHDLYNPDEFMDRIEVKISDLFANGQNGKIVSRSFNGGTLWFTVTWTTIYNYSY